MGTEYKKLYRSRDNRLVGGVCAGLAEYFRIDPTLVRLGFALGAVFLGIPGALVLVYLVMLVIVPEEPFHEVASSAPTAGPTRVIDIEPETGKDQ